MAWPPGCWRNGAASPFPEPFPLSLRLASPPARARSGCWPRPTVARWQESGRCCCLRVRMGANLLFCAGLADGSVHKSRRPRARIVFRTSPGLRGSGAWPLSSVPVGSCASVSFLSWWNWRADVLPLVQRALVQSCWEKWRSCWPGYELPNRARNAHLRPCCGAGQGSFPWRGLRNSSRFSARSRVRWWRSHVAALNSFFAAARLPASLAPVPSANGLAGCFPS
jgi:hypothetical protein